FSFGFALTAATCIVLNFGINLYALRLGSHAPRRFPATLAWVGMCLAYFSAALVSAVLLIGESDIFIVAGAWLAAADFAGESAVSVLTGQGFAYRASVVIVARRVVNICALLVIV